MDSDMETAPPVQDGNELLEHAKQVNQRLLKIANTLILRGANHDRSKFSSDEFLAFATLTHKLKDHTYGSPEYIEAFEQLRPALEHHYKHNRHHPKHFENGIKGMNLVDITEMFCDWLAATLRQKDGDIRKSLEVDQKRFEFSDDLKQIFLNTVEFFEVE